MFKNKKNYLNYHLIIFIYCKEEKEADYFFFKKKKKDYNLNKS